MSVSILRKSIYFAAALVALNAAPGAFQAVAQEPAAADLVKRPQRVISFEHANQELIIRCDVGALIVKVYAENIVNVRYHPGPVRKALPPSQINAKPAPIKYRVDSTLTVIRLTTAQLTVSIDRKTAQITFSDQKQNVLLASRQVELRSMQTAGEDTYKLHAEFIAPEDEAYYGLGQPQDGWTDQRGQTVRLGSSSRPLEGDAVALPFLVTNRNYGLILDNASKVTVAPGKGGVTTWDAEAAQVLSYFVIYGSTTDEISKGYRFLTGTTPLPPVSTLGLLAGSEMSGPQDQLMRDEWLEMVR